MYIRILIRCNQGVEPCNALQSLHSCQSCHSCHIASVTHRPHHAASHRVTPVTASHAHRSESDPLARALGLEVGGR